MATPDPAYTLTPSGNLRRRAAVSTLVQGAATASAVLAVAVLLILVGYVVVHGIKAINLQFITGGTLPPPIGPTFGHDFGIGPALVGTLEIALIAAAVAVPIGILTALYLVEFAGPKSNSVVRALVDMLNGVPTIVSGLFIYALFITGAGLPQSGFAAALALAIVMVPLVTRASLEALSRVPSTHREAADALGVSHWRSVIGVVLPGARAAILTATILAVARAAGETAPLLATDFIFSPNYQLNPFQGVPNVPETIFQLSESGFPNSFEQTWGAAFLLMLAILIANVGARAALARSNRRTGSSTR